MIAAVMLSHELRRDTERPITLSSLEAAGISPVVHETTGPPATEKVLRGSREALRGVTADALFFEDDVLVTPDLLTWLPALRSQPHIVTLCLMRRRMHPRSVLADFDAGRPIPRGILPLRGDWWWGAQALYLPASVVQRVLSDENYVQVSTRKGETRIRGFDHWLQTRIGNIHGAFPNPAQHRSPRNLSHDVQKAYYSLTYGHPSA